MNIWDFFNYNIFCLGIIFLIALDTICTAIMKIYYMRRKNINDKSEQEDNNG